MRWSLISLDRIAVSAIFNGPLNSIVRPDASEVRIFPVIELRKLLREEITQVWNIDRSEVIEKFYHLQDGVLMLRPKHIDVLGWPPGEADKYTPILLDCFDRGGWFCGAFDDTLLIGAVVLESRFIGTRRDQLQLKFLHVSRAYRNRGLGAQLFEGAMATARERGAHRLYISATPSENTINFYVRLGCTVAKEPDPDLFELEPEDIHLEFEILTTQGSGKG